MSKGIDGTQVPPNKIHDKPKADLIIEEAPPIPLEYEEMRFLDLRKECKKRSISFVQTDRKQTLIDKLKDADFHAEVAS